MAVVGCGPAGIAAARRLRERGGDAVEVVVVTRDGAAWHLPGTLDVALGDVEPDDLRVAVALEGCDCRAGDVAGIEAGAVRLSDAEPLEADAIVAAPGLALDAAAVPGWPHARTAWDVPGAARAAADLDAVPGGRLVIVVCSLPYRCPPAPFSLAMALADRHRRSGRFTRVCVTTPEPMPLAGVGGEAPAFLMESCLGAGVEVELGFAVDLAAGEDCVLRSADGRELDYELALLVPPHVRSPALAGLEGEGALVTVDAHGRTSERGVYVAGDAAGAPLPRAAGVATAQGQTAADAALADLGLAAAVPAVLPEPSCYLRHAGGTVSRIRLSYPHGLPPAADAVVDIDGPSPDLMHAAAGERERFLAAARGA